MSMSEVIGKNTADSRKILGFVERIEAQNLIKKGASEQIKIINAEVKAEGYSKEGIGCAVKARALKPSVFREGEDLRDLYLHAIGLLAPPPLFKHLETIARENLGKSELIERFKEIVPANASITIEMGGLPVRLTRDKDGNVTTTEMQPQPDRAPNTPGRPSYTPSADVPSCTPDKAEAMGGDAFDDDIPIINNPFPFGDERRMRWDRGWRKASGGDGMGPED